MKIMMTTRKSIEKNNMKSKNSIKQRTSVFSVFEAAIINFKKIYNISLKYLFIINKKFKLL
jgi:hypothetical protein